MSPTPGSLLGSGSLLQRLARRLHAGSLAATRVALGVVYLWFGMLKTTGTTPVADLVSATTPWSDPGWFLPVLGGVEVVLGGWLVIGRALAVALPLFVAHMIGTCGALVLVPHLMFQHGNPLLLTTLGVFVVKNVVLLGAGIAVMTRSLARAAPDDSPRRAVTAPDGSGAPTGLQVGAASPGVGTGGCAPSR